MASAPEAGKDDGYGREAVVLRLVHINDCYELDNLPRLATAVREAREAAAAAVARGEAKAIRVVCAVVGDFLAPSLLSCLDQGRGMIDVLNACGVDVACFGNHETDVPHAALLERIHESAFLWVNSNMPGLPLLDFADRIQAKLPESTVLEVGDSRRVGLLGLLTEDRSLYRPDSFMQTPILPVRDTALWLQGALMSKEGTQGQLDCVLAMTHQSMALDRELAALGLFPLILGGHDHEAHCEAIPTASAAREGDCKAAAAAGAAIAREECSPSMSSSSSAAAGDGKACAVVKVGMDAKLVGFTDVAWPTEATPGTEPVIRAEMKEITSFAPDPAVAERVAVHHRVLEELERASLCPCPSNLPLSSRGIRKMQTTVGTMLVTAARKALQTDCAFINAGNIRGNCAYPLDKRKFTYKDLKTEVPFTCELVVVRVPGRVLSELLAFSRRHALLDPPVEKGGFLQVDDGVRWDPVTHAVTHVGNAPLEPERVYTMATTHGVISGIDDLRPILDYRAAHPEAFPSSAEAGRPFKEVLVAHFSRIIWWDLAKNLGFQAMDSNDNGLISPRELEDAATAHYGEALSQLVVANLMTTADYNGDGHISAEEFVRICMANEELFEDGDADQDDRLSFSELWTLLKAHFEGKAETGTHSPIRRHPAGATGSSSSSSPRNGSRLTEEDVRRIFSLIDVDGTGAITWQQFRDHLARQKLPDRLII